MATLVKFRSGGRCGLKEDAICMLSDLSELTGCHASRSNTQFAKLVVYDVTHLESGMSYDLILCSGFRSAFNTWS